MGNSFYDVDIQIIFKDEEYTILDSIYIKGMDLFLSVKTADLKENKFPLQTYILPKDVK